VPGSGKYTSRHQQGITRQEEPHEHPGFYEYDHADQNRAALLDQSSNIIEPLQYMPQHFDHKSRFLTCFRITHAV
jgi:hypothetical protein